MGMDTKCVLIAGVAAVSSISTIAQAQAWANAVSGQWTVASNWNPANVPDTQTEFATLGLGAPYTVTINASESIAIRGLTISNTAAVLQLAGPSTSADTALRVYGDSVGNNGTILLTAGAGTGDCRLYFATSCLMSGTGKVRLEEAGDAVITVPAGVTFTNGGGHRLLGTGRVAASGTFNNQGTIGTELAADVWTIDTAMSQTASGIVRADRGVVQINGGSIAGGTMTSTLGGYVEVQSGTIGTILNSGELRIAGPTTSAHSSLVLGSITNNGQIRAMQGTGSGDARVQFTSNVSVAGSGQILLEEATDSVVTVSAGSTATIGPSQRVGGVGTITPTGTGKLVMNGTFQPGLPVGTLRFSGTGTVQFGTSARLDIEYVGAQHDQIVSTVSTLMLAGTVQLQYSGESTLAPCSELVIVSGPYSGAFTTLNAPAPALGKLRLIHDPGEVRIAYYPSDYDGSGFVDTDDFTAFILDFEAGLESADFDNSGFVDTDDFTAFVMAFEDGC
jgi:hypothetical protein